jgi:hypothetical protein
VGFGSRLIAAAPRLSSLSAALVVLLLLVQGALNPALRPTVPPLSGPGVDQPTAISRFIAPVLPDEVGADPVPQAAPFTGPAPDADPRPSRFLTLAPVTDTGDPLPHRK